MPFPPPTRIRAGRAALAAVATLLLATAAVSAASAETSAAGPETHRIATATLGSDLKVALTAHRAGEYEATVELTAFRHTKGGWQETDRAPVGETWFWYPLTGTGAVCELTVSDPPGAGASVTAGLLQSPSLGCSEPYTVPIDD
ncbi:hypothetical protein FZ103_18995 [Streptomonospora sp. PA3]|uniref:hypothetical protein n=1 Tax=Streptomonospora sp. PA3 TaxID=2607326 RepID=UPI0012DE178B|nr:hypothetical protein [Streptomonospora sp. PA3]MUL43227.1 hypothetical protein [Streptomonospora sp. PA3]